MTEVRDDQLPLGAGDAVEVPAVPAASVILLRDAPLEVLMIRRHQSSTFVPSAWVFPGGVAEDIDRELAREVADGSKLAAMQVTAARELFEETGVWLGGSLEGAEQKRRRLLAGSLTFRNLLSGASLDLNRLVWTSRWITPVGVPKRFDTYFFLALSSRDVTASVEEQEAVDLVWISPAEAISRHHEGEMQMVFPTLKNLEAITGFDTAAALIASRRGIEVPTTRPVLVVEGGQKKIVLPE